jgi:excisionase family DNA binding protein
LHEGLPSYVRQEAAGLLTADPGAIVEAAREDFHHEQESFNKTSVLLNDPAAEGMTVEQVARKLRVSRMAVYRLVHGGELPAVKVGRSFRVTEQDVDEYLRRQAEVG